MAVLAMLALSAVAIAGCGSSAASSAASRPAASTFEGYAVAFCAAWDSLFRGIGNPDSGVGSELYDALDDAVEAKDGLAAERLAGQIAAELETGRQAAAEAAGWAPAAPMMAEMDRVFVAFQALAAAKAAVAAEAPGAPDPQAAFEQAGGAEAWTSMLRAGQSMERAPGQVSEPCANVPITP